MQLKIVGSETFQPNGSELLISFRGRLDDDGGHITNGLCVKESRIMKTATLILMAIASLVVADYAGAQIPNTWTREKLIHLYGSRAVNIERTGSEISSISFIKQDPHSFHGGECFSLILQVIRGRGLTHSELSQNQLPGINVVDKGDDTIWADSENRLFYRFW